jgi:phage tail-like protein
MAVRHRLSSRPAAMMPDLPLRFRFSVVFLIGGVVPNLIDTMFQSVSGLGQKIATIPIEEGGQNYYTQQLPKKVQYENLVLERGMMPLSPLSREFNVTMSLFKFASSNVLVTLQDAIGLPVSSWLFMTAFPVSWSVSDLNATQSEVVIERMELSYQQMQVIRL